MRTRVRCRQCGKSFTADVINANFAGVCPRCFAAFALADDEPSQAPPPPVLKVGCTFRGLEVVDILGQGGMGIVYRARHVALGRDVALKVLSPKLAADAGFAERFGREAMALASLNHPNIVQVHDSGREGDVCFLVMELVEGVSLRDLMEQGRQPPAQALKIIPQVCDALEYAHHRGIVHRDIKPENILIDRAGTVKIADFGLAKMTKGGSAKLTQTNVVMGTPAYMAPEQYESIRTVDHRADIFSLGVVFYELLTGELPVGAFDPQGRRGRAPGFGGAEGAGEGARTPLAARERRPHGGDAHRLGAAAGRCGPGTARRDAGRPGLLAVPRVGLGRRDGGRDVRHETCRHHGAD